MAINIKFDLANNPEPPTLILANRNGNKLGQLEINFESIELVDKFNEASEISFTVNKYLNGKITNLWDKVLDFKLVYCKEWDLWFEIKVELDEATESVKTVFCTQLGQAELSQIMLYDIEINTEIDIERNDYEVAILYDPYNSQCILSRLLDKAPHYYIKHVDNTIANIQRSFSFDGTSIYDAFQEIAEEIGCLFVFHSDSDANGMPQRTISVYDLQQNCKNENCRYRGEFTDKCPKCGSIDIEYGYGKDTKILVSNIDLASQGIQLVTDTDSVKNCFKLEAGDDLMTATVRNRNPNGTDYIWYFSEATKEDMPDELVEKIESYDEVYRYYYNEHKSNLSSGLLREYNGLVGDYSSYYKASYKKDLETIDNPIMGFASLMNAYYNTIDFGWYLKSGMMPPVDIEIGAEAQGEAIELHLPRTLAVANLKSVSKATADSTALTMAKSIVSSAYKVVINSSSLSDDKESWSGSFIVTNYSDDEDTYTTYTIGCDLTDLDETYIKQRIDKILGKENTDDVSITGLFAKDYDDFCEELHKYALTPLTSFHDACQACLDILIEQGAGDKDSDLYDGLYYPYYKKLKAIASEMSDREDEINIVIDLQSDIEKIKADIQDELNFQNYLGDDLWLQFCAYRREDKYSNSNYISDGLNNAELFERALQFYEVAENEIFKSAELQHSISATLNNLLAIPKFRPLVESFEVGNWIRVQIDDYVYKLRLVEYEISYGDFNSISVEFSDVAKTKNGYSDLEDILSDASSMASSYDSIQRQANLGNEARDMIRQWLNEGLDASLVQIQNNTNEDIVIDNNGLLGRSYSDITEEYSDEQIRLTHNIIAFTDDNWETVRQAIGKHKYKYFDEGKDEFVDALGYGVSADFMTAGVVSGSQIIGGNIYSDNYSPSGGNGSYINLRKGDFSFGGGALRFEIDEATNKGKLIISSDPTSTNVTELNDEWLKTTSVYAQNLQVNSAKITGKLTANQIDASELKVDAANITGELTVGQIEDIEGKVTTIINDTVTTGYIDALEIKVDAANIDGTLTADQINLSGAITWNDLSDSVQSDIDDAYNMAENAEELAGEASNTVSGWVYEDSTYIDGTMIATGTVMASSLQGGEVLLLDKDEEYVGGLILTDSSSADYAVEFYSNEALRISADGGNLYLCSDQNSGYSALNFEGYWIYCDGHFVPANGASWYLGDSDRAWDEVYAFTYNDASDRKKKNSIEYNMEKYEDLFFKLKPTQFKFNNGTSNRYHTGFISQDIGDAIVEVGLSTQDFAAFVKAPQKDNSEQCDYYLRYDEFIALNTHMIQKLYKRVDELEAKLKSLE